MTRRRWIRFVIGAPGWAYALLIMGYLVARMLIGERWTLVEIGNSLMPPIVFPVIPLLLLALILRLWRLSVALIPALALLLFQNAPLFLPNAVTAAADSAPRVTLLTFNVMSRTDSREMVLFEAIIRGADADIVALQELMTPTANALASELADMYPYTAFYTTDGLAVGVGMYSKLPILEQEIMPDLVLHGQWARFAWQDQTFTVINAHPVSPGVWGGFNSSVRGYEIDQIMTLAAEITDPLVLMGDFNVTDQTEDYAKIAARYRDAFREAGTGFGFSFPSFEGYDRPIGYLRIFPPVIRIDYVFYDASWSAISARVLSENARSDHYPLLAELAFVAE